MRKVILYIAASLDGYIAKPNNDMHFLSLVNEEGEDYGYHSFVQSIDTVVMGRKTYDWVMTQVPEFPHKDKESYVITRNATLRHKDIHFYSGNLRELILTLKKKKGKDIFIDGGAEIVNLLLKEKLIDEFYISIIPVLLGEGTRLFQDICVEQNLKLINTKTFKKGLVQLYYKKVE